MFCSWVLLSITLWCCMVATAVSNEASFRGSDRHGRRTALDQLKRSVAGIKLVNGDVVRSFPADKYMQFSPSQPRSARRSDCDNWMVVTTIQKPTEAIRRAILMRNWCLIIILDHESPSKYDTGWVSEETTWSPRVQILTVEAQKKMRHEFIDFMPWDSFSRKNIGYLYAVSHGAKRVWDFDDKNQLNFWFEGAEARAGVSQISTVLSELTSMDDMMVNELKFTSARGKEQQQQQQQSINPYPLLGCPTHPCWPRGYPLQDIVASNSPTSQAAASAAVNSTVRTASIGIIQSLVDHEPDVDSIYRLTMGTPVKFGPSGKPPHRLTAPLLLLPRTTFAPLSAQATMHTHCTFWGLLLPPTLPSRVADIWRGYLTQRIMWEIEGDLRVAYTTRPWVVQDSEHELMPDFTEENMLYKATVPFLTFLRGWSCPTCTDVPSMLQDLWAQAYERVYVELDDVKAMQLWLKALISVGYQFPALKATRYRPKDVAKPSVSRAQAIASRPPTPGKKKNKCGDKVEDLTFLVSDLHEGTRIDLPSILANMGFKVVITGVKGPFSIWPELYEIPNVSFDMSLTSPLMKLYNSRNSVLKEKGMKMHYDFYNHKDVAGKMAEIDVFLCSFPASMCEMWLPFNKTLAFLPAHRYNLGRCTVDEWRLLDRRVRKLERDNHDDTGRWPHHIMGALSRYDREYMRYFFGNNRKITLHDWWASSMGILGKYVDMPYNPQRPEVLWAGKKPMPTHKETGILNMIKEKTLYHGHYTAQNLRNHTAIIYSPASVMSYRLIDFYALCIPLYMPSFRFVEALNLDRSSLSHLYCSNETLDVEFPPDPTNVHPYSPNSMDLESTFYWIQLADTYSDTFPHIILYDSYEDLKHKLETTDYMKVHNLMVEQNKRRLAELEEVICTSLEGIDSGREVPSKFDPSLWN